MSESNEKIQGYEHNEEEWDLVDIFNMFSVALDSDTLNPEGKSWMEEGAAFNGKITQKDTSLDFTKEEQKDLYLVYHFLF